MVDKPALGTGRCFGLLAWGASVSKWEDPFPGYLLGVWRDAHQCIQLSFPWMDLEAFVV